VQWKSNKYYISLVCLYNLRHPTRNAHAAYFLWPVPLYKMFLHYLLKSTILEKTVIEIERCVLIFSTTYLNHFLILKELREV